MKTKKSIILFVALAIMAGFTGKVMAQVTGKHYSRS